jgi:hypothetical protein
MKTYTIRPLVWVAHEVLGKRLTLGCEANTQMGRYVVDHTGAFFYDCKTHSEVMLKRTLSLRAAKAACSRHHRQQMESMLREVGGAE